MLILLQIAISITVILFLLYIGILLYKAYLKATTKISSLNGVSSLEEITLGGIKQWIFIRGQDQKNPVLLFLHGGPGEPLLGISSSRKLDAEIINHFTVVHWDQRGAGKSYSSEIPATSMTFDRLIEDCNELIDYLRNRFSSQRVFLVAHSGGTIIGLKVAHRFPEKLHAYVGISQIISDNEQERVSYDFLIEKAEESGDKKRLEKIKAIGPPPYESFKILAEKAMQIGHYGGFVHEGNIMSIIKSAFSYLVSPEYSLSEGIRTMRGKGLHFTQNAIWDEMTKIDITKEIQSIQIPIYFFEGKYDMITPTVLVERFYENLEAEKGKHLEIFYESAHLLPIEEKEKYEDLLINTILQEDKENEYERS